MSRHIVAEIIFWICVGLMALAYFTAPGFNKVWSEKLMPFYTSLWGLAMQQPDYTRFAENHARQEILTRNSLFKNGTKLSAQESFARWNQDYLNWHRQVLEKTLGDYNQEDMYCVSLYDGITSGQVRLINCELIDDRAGEHPFIKIDNTSRIEMIFTESIETERIAGLTFDFRVIKSVSSSEKQIITRDPADYMRVIWSSTEETEWQTEQSVIIPLNEGTGVFTIDLTNNYSWLSRGQVNRMLLLFKVRDGMFLAQD